ncbi:DUF3443 domain-containing protein [Rhodoferax ferrireducens]|uniref:DUF3443 domain-containing protein n=1 Tax=Rhodoferax ferrireducens TaxID=192843 RepID=UPI003BB6AAF0
MNRVLALVLVATLVTACGGGGGGSAPAPISVPGAPTLNSLPTIAPGVKNNELRIYVDAGPDDTVYNVNRLYTDVTVCYPGMSSAGSPTQCQTINHVLVDTGSFGLRLLSSAMAPALNLDRETVTGGLPLINCAQFVDLSFAWGPVVRADVVLGGKTAASVPIQVIADPSFNSPADTCSVGGTAMTTAKALGANGILGIGLFKEDCGERCNNIVNNGSYYTCTDANCTVITGAKTTSLDQQVQNPVPLFDTDNNGVQIALPAITSTGVPTWDGILTFGIGTQSLASVTVLTPDSSGYFTTVLAGQNLPNFTRSFIDSGSNGLFFESAIEKCGDGFYCPTSPTTLLATLVDAKGASSPELLFPIGNATDLFASRTNTVRNHVFPTLAGDIPGHPSTFDWGLPFFYGRRVFFGIEGQASTLGTGPFYAF